MANLLKPVNVSFKAHEFELYAYLLSQSSISIYIKDLIKADMMKKKQENTKEESKKNNNRNTRSKPIF